MRGWKPRGEPYSLVLGQGGLGVFKEEVRLEVAGNRRGREMTVRAEGIFLQAHSGPRAVLSGSSGGQLAGWRHRSFQFTAPEVEPLDAESWFHPQESPPPLRVTPSL